MIIAIVLTFLITSIVCAVLFIFAMDSIFKNIKLQNKISEHQSSLLLGYNVLLREILVGETNITSIQDMQARALEKVINWRKNDNEHI